MLEPYLKRWDLVLDGEPTETRSSVLVPVRRRGEAAMLKIAFSPEERRGAGLMAWWNGVGAARVLERDEAGLLMERATGAATLADLSLRGMDREATRVLCRVAAHLHGARPGHLPELEPLERRFRALEVAAARSSGMLRRAWTVAERLLREPRGVVVLHGDLHHANVLDFGDRGWLAIDPKGIIGERTFEFANAFCNPSLDVATAPGRIERLADTIAREAQLDRRRLLAWVVAWCGLSAAWHLEDGTEPVIPRAVAAIAAAMLDDEGDFGGSEPSV